MKEIIVNDRRGEVDQQVHHLPRMGRIIFRNTTTEAELNVTPDPHAYEVPTDMYLAEQRAKSGYADADTAAVERAGQRGRVVRNQQIEDDRTLAASLWAAVPTALKGRYYDASAYLDTTKADAARAGAELSAHQEQRPQTADEVPAWALRRTHLQEQYSAYEELVTSARNAYHDVSGKVQQACWDAYNERKVRAVAQGEHDRTEARGLRGRADALDMQANRRDRSIERFKTNLESFGLKVFDFEGV
jgi:hypothetical protein